MPDRILKLIPEGEIIILGFGMEGKSTYGFLRKRFPDRELIVADADPAVAKDALLSGDPHTRVIGCGDYPGAGISPAMVIKTPGIPSARIPNAWMPVLSSQTDLFLRACGRQVAGITGTKGKSTTSSLLHHILTHSGKPGLLMGNIGIPPLDLVEKMSPDTIAVCELSSHQLEHVKASPHVSVLLNLFEEHLDHYATFRDYQSAKFNIARFQGINDVLIYHAGDDRIARWVREEPPVSEILTFGFRQQGADIEATKDEIVFFGKSLMRPTDADSLPGEHNLLNVMAASAAAIRFGVHPDAIPGAVSSFVALRHRIEYCGTFAGIRFYNDSISTIPEATMAAVRALPETGSLILGGKDRGIAYESLMDFLEESDVKTLVFTGPAGERMLKIYRSRGHNAKNCILAGNFDDAVYQAASAALPGSICLLSPAASSYDAFTNFAERGDRFIALATEWAVHKTK